MATEQATIPTPASETGVFATFRALHAFFKRNVTKRVGTAVIFWRVEARFATPLGLVFVANLGRWNGALAMGTVMAVYSALFLFLLDGERVIEEMRSWLRQKKWGHRALHLAERQDRTGAVQRTLAAPVTVMLEGPFWRGITYRVGRVKNVQAYALSVGGSYPHSLFWTGLVLGALWESLLGPLWHATIGPPVDAANDAVLHAIWSVLTAAVGLVG